MVLGKRKQCALDTHDQQGDSIYASPIDDVCQSTKRMRLEFSPDSPSHISINFVNGICVDSKPTPAPASSEVFDELSVEDDQHNYYRNKELVQQHKRHVEVVPQLPTAYDEKHRSTCGEWLGDVVEETDLSSLPVHQALLLMDRFLAQQPNFPKTRYQLLAATAFWVAAKREELEDYVPTLNDLVLLCANQFTKGDFVRMESYLLNTLHWEIAEVTPLHFLDYYLQRCMTSEELERVTLPQLRKCSQFLVDICVHDRKSMQDFLPSKVAAASLVTARAMFGLTPCIDLLEKASRYKFSELHDCYKVMWEYGCNLQDEGQ